LKDGRNTRPSLSIRHVQRDGCPLRIDPAAVTVTEMVPMGVRPVQPGLGVSSASAAETQDVFPFTPCGPRHSQRPAFTDATTDL